LLTALATLSLVTGTFIAAGTALAVHDTGAFELDGNATNDPALPGDDWDNVCHQVTGSDCSTTSNTTGATAVAFAGDGALNATIFTGGGSKDPIDINNWAWKDGGGLPDKDNLLHSFAARYSLPADTTADGTLCPAGTATTCDLLYFGSDRYDNSGDAQQGFWFFQKKIGLGTNSVGGGSGFTGVHTPGDILVISDFSTGGTVSIISIYKWNPTKCVTGREAGCGDQNLELLGTSTTANCATATAGDAFCGLVNPTDGTIAPWPFTDKSGNSTYLQGEFYEGGINLSVLGLAGECFSSALSETRASTSTTAVLKDFILSQFNPCKPAMTTTASTNGNVLPGIAVHDTATITVTGGTNPPDPTGTVTFYLCKVATGDCGTSGGTLIGTGTLANQTGGTTTDGIATADSPNVNCASNLTGCAVTDPTSNPLAPGRYCFRATWPGDSNYDFPLNVTNSVSECFTVADTSSMTTHQIWLPNDKATVTSTGGTALNGTVKFELYSGGTCSGTKLWPTATDLAGTGEFTLTSATSPATVGPTTNTAITVEADATVSWKVVFTSSDSGVASPAVPQSSP